MTDRPIIFSAPMIRALLDGRKTQTRRQVTQRNTLFDGRDARWTNWLHESAFKWADAWVDPGPSPAGNPGPYLKLPVIGLACDPEYPQEETVHRIYPRIQPGCRLWVREAHALVGTVDPGWLLYRADGYESECIRHGFTRPFPPETAVRWRPSIHMPRWASRLTLIVTDVRVQRLQDISEADAVAEGIDLPLKADQPPTMRFQSLWNSLHGPEAWDANPWVVALTFDVHRGNIDALTPRPEGCR
jgi:hypothetical protein